MSEIGIIGYTTDEKPKPILWHDPDAENKSYAVEWEVNSVDPFDQPNCSVTVPVGSGLTVDATAFTANKQRAFISGGTIASGDTYTDYEVLFHAAFASGYVDEQSIVLRVTEH